MSMGGSSGGGTTYSEVTQHSSNLPEYAEPYFHDLLARAGYQSSVPYEAYGGQRLAYFSPAEQEAMARMGELGVSGTPQELITAAGMAQGASGLINTGPVSSGYTAGDIGGIGSYNPSSRQSGYTADSRSSMYEAGSRDSQFEAGQLGERGRYEGANRDVAFVPGTLDDSEMLERYMDPYMQQVVDIEKREARREADKTSQDISLEAAGEGSLGGYREAILQAENERNLQQRMTDIQTRGSQQAFVQAKEAFEMDRQARAKLEEYEQNQFQLNEAINARVAELEQQGFSLEEASRMAQEEFAQQQFSLNQQALQAQEQFHQAQFGLNEAAAQAQEGFEQSQFGLNAQESQFAASHALNAYNAYENAKQQAAALGLTAQQIEQAGQIAAAQAQLQGAGMLSDLALQNQGMELDRLNAMMMAGGMERGLMQQSLDMGYQDYLRLQAYPWEQLGMMANLMYGLPVTPGGTTSVYGPAASNTQQLLGAGIASWPLWQMAQGATP